MQQEEGESECEPSCTPSVLSKNENENKITEKLDTNFNDLTQNDISIIEHESVGESQNLELTDLVKSQKK